MIYWHQCKFKSNLNIWFCHCRIPTVIKKPLLFCQQSWRHRTVSGRPTRNVFKLKANFSNHCLAVFCNLYDTQLCIRPSRNKVIQRCKVSGYPVIWLSRYPGIRVFPQLFSLLTTSSFKWSKQSLQFSPITVLRCSATFMKGNFQI